MLLKTISTLFRICFFKQGPQDILYSPALLIQIMGLFIALVLTVLLQGLPVTSAVLFVISALGITAAFLYAILSKLNLISRFVQLYISFIGVALIFDMLGASIQMFIGLNFGLLSVLFLWKLFIYKYLFQQALNVSSVQAFAMVVLYGLTYGVFFLGIANLIGLSVPQVQ